MEDLLFLSEIQKKFQIGLVSILPELYVKKLNMIPIPLEESTREKLEQVEKVLDEQMKPILEREELIHKAMNDINTFQCCDGELYLRGTDEYGKDFQVCFDAYNFLNWIDTEQIEYIKEQLIKHIKTK